MIGNLYTPNVRAPNFIKHTIRPKREMGSNTIIVGHFNTPLSSMDMSFRQKSQK
jgi:hypothetical protein